MNKIVNKFLLAGDKLMPEMHLEKPGFTYSVCGPFTKNKEGIQKFKEMGDTGLAILNALSLKSLSEAVLLAKSLKSP